ncbi:hypothetical protein U1Q18_015881 [Sarracenia purpurea var. burkii]
MATSSSTIFFTLREGHQNQMKQQHSSTATWSQRLHKMALQLVQGGVDSNVSFHRETEEDVAVVGGRRRSGAGLLRRLLKTVQGRVGTSIVKVGRLAEEGSESPEIH